MLLDVTVHNLICTNNYIVLYGIKYLIISTLNYGNTLNINSVS